MNGMVLESESGSESDASQESSSANARALTLHLREMQMLVVISGLMLLQHTVVIPGAYDLATDMGQGAEFSGFIISVGFGPSFIGVLLGRFMMTPWHQGLSRTAIFIATLALSCFSLMGAMVLDPPESITLSNEERIYYFMLSRAAIGFLASGYRILLKQMLLKVTPKDEVVTYVTITQACNGIGFGLGPVLASVVCWSTGAATPGARVAMPLYAVTVLNIFLCLATVWILPCDDRELQKAKRRIDDAAGSGSDPPTTCGADAREANGGIECNQQLWIIAVLIGINRATLVSALEAASALIFEIEFGMDPLVIGYAVGATLVVVAVPLTMVAGSAMRLHYVSEARVGLICAVLCSFGIIFLFKAFGGFWVVCVADSIIYPTGYLASSILSGYALRYARTDSWCSSENYMVASNLSENSIARLIGPPLARHLVATDGRDAYANIQLVLSFLSICFVWKANALVATMSDQMQCRRALPMN